MKQLSIFFMLSMMVVFASCTTEEETATAEGWKISKFIDKEADKTVNFTGYIFDFLPSGVVTATKGNSTIDGLWKEVNATDKSTFVLSFGSPDSFVSLSEEWLVRNKSNTSMQLIKTENNSADLGVSILEFSK